MGLERDKFTESQDLDQRRFELDQSRLEIDERREKRLVEIDHRQESAEKEERKVALADWKELLGVLSALSRKLS